MIHRFVSLLLVFLVLANQGLCFAHVHHSGVAVPEGHGARPHIHVGGHVHHDRKQNHKHDDHSHPDHSDNVPDDPDEPNATLPPGFSPVGEHESDAVYFGEPMNVARTGNAANVLPEKDAATSTMLQVANQNDGLRDAGPLCFQPRSVFAAACPIYLRTLSLRL